MDKVRWLKWLEGKTVKEVEAMIKRGLSEDKIKMSEVSFIWKLYHQTSLSSETKERMKQLDLLF